MLGISIKEESKFIHLEKIYESNLHSIKEYLSKYFGAKKIVITDIIYTVSGINIEFLIEGISYKMIILNEDTNEKNDHSYMKKIQFQTLLK